MTSFSRMKFSMQWSISVFITSCPQNTVYIFSLNVKSMFIHNFDILTVTSLPQRNTKAINWSSLWCQWSNVVLVNSRRSGAAPSPATPRKNPSPGLFLWQAWVHIEVAVLHTATSRLSCKQLGLFRRKLSPTRQLTSNLDRSLREKRKMWPLVFSYHRAKMISMISNSKGVLDIQKSRTQSQWKQLELSCFHFRCFYRKWKFSFVRALLQQVLSSRYFYLFIFFYSAPSYPQSYHFHKVMLVFSDNANMQDFFDA